ncbi:MAG: hypothetical protein EWM73_00437 [Nitrospira sp.]|nr:MAG: hypothetical protein EWM73_00437 [Nitrospira sp.]
MKSHLMCPKDVTLLSPKFVKIAPVFLSLSREPALSCLLCIDNSPVDSLLKYPPARNCSGPEWTS